MNINNRICVALVSDLHANSTTALCPPVVQLDDGGNYHPSRGQSWLYSQWLDFWKQASEFAGDAEKILIINGDAVQLDIRNRTFQLITRNPTTALGIALDVIAPAADWADKVYIVRGTEAHTGKSASGEEAIARDLDNVIPAGEKIFSHWHIQKVASGVKFDVTHHSKMGGLPWTEKMAAIRLGQIAIARYNEHGEQPPDIIARSHVHRYSDSGDNLRTAKGRRILAFTLPAWELKTAFSYRIGFENDLSDFGGVLIMCEDGKWNKKLILYEPRRTDLWKTAF